MRARAVASSLIVAAVPNLSADACRGLAACKTLANPKKCCLSAALALPACEDKSAPPPPCPSEPQQALARVARKERDQRGAVLRATRTALSRPIPSAATTGEDSGLARRPRGRVKEIDLEEDKQDRRRGGMRCPDDLRRRRGH